MPRVYTDADVEEFLHKMLIADVYDEAIQSVKSGYGLDEATCGVLSDLGLDPVAIEEEFYETDR